MTTIYALVNQDTSTTLYVGRTRDLKGHLGPYRHLIKQTGLEVIELEQVMDVEAIEKVRQWAEKRQALVNLIRTHRLPPKLTFDLRRKRMVTETIDRRGVTRRHIRLNPKFSL